MCARAAAADDDDSSPRGYFMPVWRGALQDEIDWHGPEMPSAPYCKFQDFFHLLFSFLRENVRRCLVYQLVTIRLYIFSSSLSFPIRHLLMSPASFVRSLPSLVSITVSTAAHHSYAIIAVALSSSSRLTPFQRGGVCVLCGHRRKSDGERGESIPSQERRLRRRKCSL